MDAPPKRNQLPLKQLLILGLIGVAVLMSLWRTMNTPPTLVPVQVTFKQVVNIRVGPSTKFNPPVGSFAADQTAELIAKDSTGGWYKVTGTGGTGWVFAAYITVSGDIGRIPIDDGPPIPADTPAPMPMPTTTPVSPSAANLVLGNVSITPSLSLKCGKQVEFKIDIANLGTQDTDAEGKIVITDYWNGLEQASAHGTFPVIEPGKTINIAGVFLTVSTNTNEDHKLIISLNPSGAVPESTQTDNSREFTYKLQPC